MLKSFIYVTDTTQKCYSDYTGVFHINSESSWTKTRLKETINATVPPYIKRRAEELVESGDFTSISDVVTTALSEFFVNYEARKKAKEMKKEREAQKS